MYVCAACCSYRAPPPYMRDMLTHTYTCVLLICVGYLTGVIFSFAGFIFLVSRSSSRTCLLTQPATSWTATRWVLSLYRVFNGADDVAVLSVSG